MNDRFGDVMLSNLRSRGCSLAGVEACITLDTQILRYQFTVVDYFKIFLVVIGMFSLCKIRNYYVKALPHRSVLITEHLEH